jgi:hypothetical protein
MEVVVSQNVQEGEQAAVDPPPPLAQQGRVLLHRVSVCDGIWNVFKSELSFLLTVNTQTQNSVLSQVHIALIESVTLFRLRVQNWLEVATLQQSLLVLVRLYKCSISVSRPRSWQHMEEAGEALKILVEKVSDNVFVLLSLLDRGTTTDKWIFFILIIFARISLEGGKVTVYAHKTSHSAYVLVRVETPDKIGESVVVALDLAAWLSPYI